MNAKTVFQTFSCNNWKVNMTVLKNAIILEHLFAT